MRVSVSTAKPGAINADCLVALVWAEDISKKEIANADLQRLDRDARGALTEFIKRGVFKGNAGDCVDVTGRSGQPWVFLGAGKRKEIDSKGWMTLAAKAAKQAEKIHAKNPAMLVRAEINDDEITLLAQGAHLGAYRYDGKTLRGKPSVRNMTLALEGDEEAMKIAATKGDAVGNALTLARNLVNAPGNLLTPTHLAERARDEARDVGLEVDVIGKTELEDMGAGGLLGVAQGSTQPPVMMVFRHRPDRAGKTPHLGLVGKGVTFDTGGISLKPSEKMDAMKMDMGGAAAVIGAMIAIAALDLPVNVTAVVPATENMPGGSAVKPGDVMRMLSGKTVENLNTDAEGRLILADALHHICKEYRPTHLLDFATLTGACIVAVGQQLTGAFSNDDGWRGEVCCLSAKAGEGVWPLPLNDDFREQIKKSDVADLRNMGAGRWGGASTAAAFLEQFISGSVQWCHLDIAGPAMVDAPFGPYQTKGGSGAGLLIAVEVARKLAMG